jgi:hypothetical protein
VSMSWESGFTGYPGFTGFTGSPDFAMFSLYKVWSLTFKDIIIWLFALFIFLGWTFFLLILNSESAYLGKHWKLSGLECT